MIQMRTALGILTYKTFPRYIFFSRAFLHYFLHLPGIIYIQLGNSSYDTYVFRTHPTETGY